jgi:hypothetical protein
VTVEILPWIAGIAGVICEICGEIADFFVQETVMRDTLAHDSLRAAEAKNQANLLQPAIRASCHHLDHRARGCGVDLLVRDQDAGVPRCGDATLRDHCSSHRVFHVAMDQDQT